VEYARMLGIPPNMVNPESVIAQVRAQRQQEAAAAQAMQATQAAAQTAKVASETDVGGDNALSRLLNTAGGGGGAIA
jgi:hypothetical protein